MLKFGIFIFLVCVLGHEMLVTKEYTDYLKKHVSWEVIEYEENIFKGWTMEEANMFLGATAPDLDVTSDFDQVTPDTVLPSSLSWEAQNCDHGVKNQGRCGSCWAVATAGMLSDRCCLQGKDAGWLSAQELVSCDKKSKGCAGGWCTWALDYAKTVKGLVPEACYPYEAMDKPCPSKCVDGKPWAESHVCNCPEYKNCVGIPAIKTCLKSGPVTVAFGVCKSFFAYKSGIYKCDCAGNYAGLHAVLAMGYKDAPECSWRVRNSWGTAWGDKGYFDIGCNECGIQGTYPNGNVMCEKVS